MPIGFSFARADGGAELFNGVATAGQTTIAAQTTLVAAATVLTGGVNFVNPAAGSTALVLPLNPVPGTTVVVFNASTTVTALVYPPWNSALSTPAPAGGRVYGLSATPAVAPTSNAAVAIAPGRCAIFYGLPSATNAAAVAAQMAVGSIPMAVDYMGIWAAIA